MKRAHSRELVLALNSVKKNSHGWWLTMDERLGARTVFGIFAGWLVERSMVAPDGICTDSIGARCPFYILQQWARMEHPTYEGCWFAGYRKSIAKELWGIDYGWILSASDWDLWNWFIRGSVGRIQWIKPSEAPVLELLSDDYLCLGTKFLGGEVEAWVPTKPMYSTPFGWLDFDPII